MSRDSIWSPSQALAANSGRTSMKRTALPPDPRTPGAAHSAERLVGFTFRRAYTGLSSGDRFAETLTHHEFRDAAGLAAADRLLKGICRFAGSVQQNAGRKIEVLPPGCPGFCRDECLAISIVAACQHDTCPALRACVYALLNSNVIDPTIEAATLFATDLSAAGQMLSINSICNATAITASEFQRPS